MLKVGIDPGLWSHTAHFLDCLGFRLPTDKNSPLPLQTPSLPSLTSGTQLFATTKQLDVLTQESTSTEPPRSSTIPVVTGRTELATKCRRRPRDMSPYTSTGGGRAPNVSRYLRDLNTVKEPGSAAEENFTFEDDLAMFTNTQFFDFDSGRHTDFQAPPSKPEAVAESQAPSSAVTEELTSPIGDFGNVDFSMSGKKTLWLRRLACCIFLRSGSSCWMFFFWRIFPFVDRDCLSIQITHSFSHLPPLSTVIPRRSCCVVPHVS